MEKLVNVWLGNRNVNEYSVVLLKKTEAAVYAASEFLTYLSKIGIHLSLSYIAVDTAQIVLDYKDEYAKKDKFSISFKNENLYLCGNNARSLIYAVYEFLERIGWRFFAPQMSYRGVERGKYMYACEKFIGEDNVYIPNDLDITQEAIFDYRDGSSFVTRTEEEFCAKLRLNAETWDYHKFGEKLGGSVHFAGIHGHTFERLLPLSKFGESNPEFYAEIDGKRRTYGVRLEAPQYCLSNFESVPYVAESVKELLAVSPNASFVSVSQNDSKLHCQCENCKKSYEQYGNFGTLIRYVNKVAEIVEKDYPDVYIHTYVYEWSTQNFKTGVKANKNVLAQWCPTNMCRNHALNDENCAVNRHWYEQLKKLSEICDNLFIYDYRSCLKYAMLNFTDIFTLRDTMKTYAECNVKGIYSELCLHTYNQPTFEELRAYLFGKLTWNPYMSQEEFDNHIREFLQGYYGDGWKYIYEYLISWSNVNPDLHYTSFYSDVVNEDGSVVLDSKGKVLQAHIVKEKDFSAVIEHLNGLLDKALAVVSPEHSGRIEIIQTGLIWYELYHKMSDVLENGDEEAKKEIIARNRDLCSRMRKYQMKYTTYIGMGNTTYMYDDFALSPDKWKYTGESSPNKRIF